MTLLFTDPASLHPVPEHPGAVPQEPLLNSPLIEAGDSSFYDDPDDPAAFESRNVLYHYDSERLVIDKYCALGTGARFLMNGANHRMDGTPTFPFLTTGGSWAEHFDLIFDLSGRGDTDVGNDVGFGNDAAVMPGVRIGHGALIAADALVTSGVPPYGIVGSDSARLIRTRCDATDIARLLAVAWWTGLCITSLSTFGRSCREL